jgi:hypothetical protein
MPARSPQPRAPAKVDERFARQQSTGRRVALLVAAAVIAALLGPFFVAHFAG